MLPMFDVDVSKVFTDDIESEDANIGNEFSKIGSGLPEEADASSSVIDDSSCLADEWPRLYTTATGMESHKAARTIPTMQD
ncbi:unnamed protein product [Danaus chrysippus]|uniref:(African queen) hypothetical protein n=1 Tax=Danaus chrysippus TaxID=151541 RepID=A0A8J2R0L4_9NEOP|nr:unnamed protein product [Danaus chrysippus]